MRTWRMERLAGVRLVAAGLLLSVSLTVTATTRYVDVNNPTPASPYTNWSSAAVTIQAAVDAAATGDQILVTNGVYQSGGRTMVGSMSNRVAVYRAVTVRSVNGPEVTVIRGYQVPNLTNGDGTVRCVYLTGGATLAGFTLADGATRAASGVSDEQLSGGGLWCIASSAVASNCVLTGNSAYHYGGGVYGGTLKSCIIASNSAPSGGGAYSTTLTNCTLTGNSAVSSGGGAYSGTLINCTLSGNSAQEGGGTYSATLTNCTLTTNTASDQGGGAIGGTLTGCTLTANSAASSGGGAAYATLTNCMLTADSASQGGGAYYCTLNNCTLTGNSASLSGGGAYWGTVNGCAFTSNSAPRGGGACNAPLNNCTLTGNSASIYAGGAYGGSLTNCILYYNAAGAAPNYYAGALNYCCTTPLPTNGTGNLDAEPQLAGDSHLSATSPCRGAGSTASTKGTDIDGEPWADPPSIGCDEIYAGTATGPLTVSIQAPYSNVVAGFTANFTAAITGRLKPASGISAMAWW